MNRPLVDYTDRRVVVTGAASGIGCQLADLLVSLGASVIGADRQPVQLANVERRPLDLSSPDSVDEFVAGLDGPVDALFNVAGVSGTIGAELIVAINFAGTRRLTEALLERMADGSAVVNTASIAASRYQERRALVSGLLAAADHDAAREWCSDHPDEVGTGYAVSKDALIWYTLERAHALAGRGIRMNAVAPGITDTPILDASRAARGDAFLDDIPMPMGRMAQPAEQARVMAFLGSDAASYLSGQVLWVDGGYSAGVAVGALENVTGSVGTTR